MTRFLLFIEIYPFAPVPGSVHYFQLYKDSDLDKRLIRKIKSASFFLDKTAITLADSGYQGISARIPGVVTPYKRRIGAGLTE